MTTDRHLAAADFEQFVETIAENNRKRDGSSPRHVAQCTIVGTTLLKDNITGEPVHALTFNPEPYYDGERAYPKDILIGCDSSCYPYTSNPDASLREIAVDVLAEAISEYYDETSWEQGDRTMKG